MTRLFLDDERYPPSDYNVWWIARSLDDVKRLYEDGIIPDFISFDHDLGENQPTGMDVVKWLVDRELNGIPVFPAGFSFYVHSQNPVGAANIQSYLDSYLKQK